MLFITNSKKEMSACCKKKVCTGMNDNLYKSYKDANLRFYKWKINGGKTK